MKLAILMAIVFMVGCATGITGLMRFQDRELLIHPDKPGLAYPHNKEVCKERSNPFKFLGKKCETKHVVDFYDMNDKAIRDKLRAAGFSCKSAMRFKYN